mgnify:CR=1 FL=1
MSYFLRLTKYSDKNWHSYKMPDAHDWNTKEFETLQDMIDLGAYETSGLAGIEWEKPYFEDDDFVFSEDSSIFIDGEGENLNILDLLRNGYIIRLYYGQKIEDMQDGVIFLPIEIDDNMAKELMDEFDIEIYSENYNRGLLQADGSTLYFTFDEIYDV